MVCQEIVQKSEIVANHTQFYLRLLVKGPPLSVRRQYPVCTRRIKQNKSIRKYPVKYYQYMNYFRPPAFKSQILRTCSKAGHDTRT